MGQATRPFQHGIGSLIKTDQNNVLDITVKLNILEISRNQTQLWAKWTNSDNGGAMQV